MKMQSKIWKNNLLREVVKVFLKIHPALIKKVKINQNKSHSRSLLQLVNLELKQLLKRKKSQVQK